MSSNTKICPNCGRESYAFVAKCIDCGYAFPVEDNGVKYYSSPIKKGAEDTIIPVLSLVLGIVGLVLSCLLIGIIPALASLILGIVALCKDTEKRGMAISGIVCSSIGFLVFIIVFIMIGDTGEMASKQDVLQKQIEELNEMDIYENIPEKDKNVKVKNEDKEIQEPFELSAGVYVVGEDINAGKYDIIAIQGGSNVFIYSSYEEFYNDGYAKFGYILGIEQDYDMYSEKASNIRLSNGEVLEIHSGLVVEMVEK